MFLSQVGIIFIVILVAITGFYAGRILNDYEREGLGRDYPQTLRHPDWLPSSTKKSGPTRRKQGGGLNDVVDNMKNQYFDSDNYPYNDAARLDFLNMFVYPYKDHNVVDSSNVSHLTDMGFYFIREVIPRLLFPARDADLFRTAWNPIIWSTSPNILSNNLDFGVNMAVWATTDPRGFRKPAAALAPSPSPTDSTSSTGSGSNSGGVTGAGGSGQGGSGGSGNGGSSACNTTEGCDQPCPTSCIQAALMSLSPKPAETGSKPTSGSNLSQFNRNLKPSELKEWWALFAEDDDSGATSRQPGGDDMPATSNQKVRIVKTDTFPVTPNANGTYDKNLNNLIKTDYIDWYFDPVDGYPTQKFLDQYLKYRQGLGTLDEAHANKLTDMVFYAMETLVGGLAVDTQSSPVFKFSWAPFRELSARHF